MGVSRKVSRDYRGRQVDIELLKHVEEMRDRQVVSPDVPDSPRLVAGREKVVQRYAKLFLTGYGSVKSDQDIGSDLLSEVAAGRVTDEAYLDHLCAIANASAVVAMSADDSDESFGSQPPDERLESVELSGVSLDRASGRAHVKARITTGSGDDFEFIIPIESGLSA